MKVFLLVTLFAACVFGHTCLLNPAQRGPLTGINKIHDPNCGLMNGPCGGLPRKPATLQYEAGSTQSIVWQKNLDHYTTADPGKWVLSWSTDEESWTQLFSLADTNTSSLTIYEHDITFPPVQDYVKIVLQFQYQVSFGTFYQCADVELY